MKKGLLFFIFLSSFFFSYRVFAQCAENLSQAQEAFDNGHLYGIPALLSDCIEKGSVSDQDQIEAYRLLTLTYLYIDDPIAAQNSFLALLKLDPEYRVDSTNHIEIVHLSKEYITTPIVSGRVRLGANMTNIATIHENGSYVLTNSKEKYTAAVGLSAIGSFDVHISKFISFSVESDLQYSAFKYANTVFSNSNGEPNSKDEIDLQEKAWSISLPISIKLTYPGEIYYPYVYGGYSPNYNIITNTDATYKKIDGGDGGAQTITQDNNLDISDLREDFSHSFIVGAGIMRRINYNYIFIDIRYKIGMNDRLVREEQFNVEGEGKGDINKYTLTYQQQDNFFRENQLNITVGYVWPKYKPRKRKSVTATSFIGGLFKKKQKDE